MWINGRWVVLAAPADGGEGGEGGGEGGAGGGGGPTITPEIQALIDASVNAVTGGLKAKNTELLGSLRTLKDDLKRFEGIDPDAVSAMLARFANDEEQGLLKAGKIDEVLNKRTERMQADHAKVLDTLKGTLTKAEQKAAKLAQRTLNASIKDAAIKAGALPEALDDIVLRSASTWHLNDDGEPVAVAGEELVMGKDGKTPLSISEYMDSMRETASHLWPRAQGSNARGTNTDPVQKQRGKAPKREDFDSDISYSKASARFHAEPEE